MFGAKLLLVLFGCLVGLNQAQKIVTNSSYGKDFLKLVTGFDSAVLVANPCQDVRMAGFVCVDCSTLGFCSYEDGQWQTVPMTECRAERGFYCSDEGNIGCTWQSECHVPVRGKFYCQLPGIFPDPYDCRSYHECNEQNVNVPRRCTNGAAYSLLTHSCSLPRSSEQCTNKQYNCSYVGQMGAWASNSSYYYICQQDKQGDQDIFYPLMMRCSDGYSFKGQGCVPDTQPMLLNTDPELSQCIDGVVYPATTINGFNVCYKDKLIFQDCPEGNYFNSTLGYCLKQKEEMCQEGMFYPAATKYGFYFCLNGTQIYQNCSAGYHFDLTQRLCIKEDEQCEELRLYPAETEHGYLLCNSGELTSYSCPEGSIFDGQLSVCTPQHIY